MNWSCSLVVTFVLLLLLPFMASPASVVKNLPGFNGDLPFNLETGYIGVGEGEEVQIFYLFVESQRHPMFDPLLIWFVGGPGCSGLSAFFFENGPLTMDRNYSGDLPKLVLNPYAWSQRLNMIYIDMPVGTGFSYSETQQGYYSSNTLWVEHTYSFLQKVYHLSFSGNKQEVHDDLLAFAVSHELGGSPTQYALSFYGKGLTVIDVQSMRGKNSYYVSQWFIDHPKFGSNPFYVGGGSFSGIITGPLVQKVYEGYIARSKPLMNIKGYVIASPLVDGHRETNMKVLYAYQRNLIPAELYESMKENCDGNYVNIDPENSKCVSDYKAYSELVRYINPQQILEPLCVTTPAVNLGIIQSGQDGPEFWCRSYDHILIDIWANDENVRKALHIREGTKEEFLRCNKTLAYTKNKLNVVEYYRNLTNANLQALVYCSDLDMSIPHLGTHYWIKSLNLSLHDKWRAWFVDGQVAGFTEIYKMKEDHYLSYVTVKGAGHVAHTFKPKEVYDMIGRWFSYSLI